VWFHHRFLRNVRLHLVFFYKLFSVCQCTTLEYFLGSSDVSTPVPLRHAFPEDTRYYNVQLVKDEKGLGITIAGFLPGSCKV